MASSFPPLGAATRDAIIRGQSLHQAGRHAEAARLLVPIAATLPGMLDLQMMAALSARNSGDHGGAIACLQRALACQPGNPQIENILANTLSAAGRFDEALALFGKLLARQQDFVDGHVNRALCAEESGDAERGLALIDESLGRFPEHPRLLAIRGTLLKNLDRLDEALEALERALVLEPTRARTHLNRGVVLRALERPVDALEAYQLAEQHGIDPAQIAPLRAAALLEAGDVAAAQTLYETAFAAGDPLNEAGPALARLQREYLGADDPLVHYALRAQRQAQDGHAWEALLSARMEYRQWAQLRDEGRDAAARFPDNFNIALYSALGEAWAGDRTAGIDRLAKLAAQVPESVAVATSLAELYCTAGDPAKAEVEARRAAQIAPHDQSGWAWLATAWRMLDDPREYWLCDYERFVIKQPVIHPDAPDAVGFAIEVAEALDRLHATRHAPGNQSLRHGTQTSGFLFARRDPVIQKFRTGLLGAIERGTAGLGADPEHPLLSRRSDHVRFVGAWSVRLSGGDGHHVAHYHSEGWMSSAYYARLPKGLGQSGEEGDDGGFIQFGAPPAHLGLDLTPRLRLRPEQGCLVMFPSYMWHGTLPFAGDDTRMTAAFDFVPQ